MSKPCKLAIVVPCYNEEEMLPITTKALLESLDDLEKKGLIEKGSFVLYVDDGSKDKTWELIAAEHEKNPVSIYGLKLAGNVGHQFALTAGLLTAKDCSDVTISIDADLQDDVRVFEDMMKKYHDGCDIVYGVRNSRKKDTFFKRTTAQGFYKVMSSMGVKTVYNHADFRLMSKRSLEAFAEYPERNLFLRGIVPLIGFKTDSVYYERLERVAGESKYPLKKMMALAIEGITSFSVKPIQFITFFGIMIVVLSFLALIYVLVSYFFLEVNPGWASTFLSIWFIGGVQLISIGLIGQYIGKIYIEVKQRPRYHIETFLSSETEE
ncbi:MAG: glycosyltransferase family 2 protein [Lachnospiraceae bacterium]|nr:glycosyltransferase family 2 protein [Lachnospiraceae bacterium]